MDPSAAGFTSLLCSRGCGFYGTAENGGLCSKCFIDYLKKTMSILSIPPPVPKRTDEPVDSFDNNINPTVSVAKSRCLACNKAVGLLGFGCRCGGSFCGMHRYPEAHSCKHDFKTVGRIALAMENPVCRAEKMTDRI